MKATPCTIQGTVISTTDKEVRGAKSQFVGRSVALSVSYDMPPDKDGNAREPREVELPVRFDGEKACEESAELVRGDVIELAVVPWGFAGKDKTAWYAQHRYAKGTLKVLKRAEEVTKSVDEAPPPADEDVTF